MKSTLSKQLLSLLALAALVACGGQQKNSETGSSTATSTSSGDNKGDTDSGDVTDDVDAPLGGTEADAGVGEPVDEPEGPKAPVTFRLKNSADVDLALNMDKGWQPIIFAYSGTPPNAKSILMFPTHCTASCDSAAGEICPYCPEPERVKDIKAAENHDHVKPGDTREVGWDGLQHVYEKCRGNRDGKKVRCKCFKKEDVPAATYTVKACGLRKTQTAKSSSKYQCVESEMTLPAAEPIVVELDFGNP